MNAGIDLWRGPVEDDGNLWTMSSLPAAVWSSGRLVSGLWYGTQSQRTSVFSRKRPEWRLPVKWGRRLCRKAKAVVSKEVLLECFSGGLVYRWRVCRCCWRGPAGRPPCANAPIFLSTSQAAGIPALPAGGIAADPWGGPRRASGTQLAVAVPSLKWLRRLRPPAGGGGLWWE